MLCANWKRRVLAARQGDCWFAGGEVGVVAFVVKITEGGDDEEEEEGVDGPKHLYKKEFGLKGATAGMERNSNCSIAKLLKHSRHTSTNPKEMTNEVSDHNRQEGALNLMALQLLMVVCAVLI
jgi:hypothetical protein